VNVDEAKPPYQNSRRLTTAANVKENANRAHSSVVPGSGSVKDAAGHFVHEEVWRYLYTHPVDLTGAATAQDADCEMDLRKAKEKE
jgi:hypothetical protein